MSLLELDPGGFAVNCFNCSLRAGTSRKRQRARDCLEASAISVLLWRRESPTATVLLKFLKLELGQRPQGSFELSRSLKPQINAIASIVKFGTVRTPHRSSISAKYREILRIRD
jgi:hypothetical protein